MQGNTHQHSHQHLNQRQEMSLNLEWKNVSLINKAKDGQKQILNNLNGKINSGDFLTIMGPSGAGKSSFLSILTKDRQSFSNTLICKGTTLINGKTYTSQEFSRISSYVKQDDILLQTLTIKCTNDKNQETFLFQAKLRLYTLSQSQMTERIDTLLKELNLFEVQNSFIGGKLIKSISGGQKKRVAIGLQLISNPLCIILDQPTSGLDSVNSLNIINILVKLAKQQHKLIIATIHQPSSLMFQNFDKLLILKNGRQIYFEKANNLVSYMENIGVKINYLMNPSDFFMLQISSFREGKGYKTNMTVENFQTYKIKDRVQYENQKEQNAKNINIKENTYELSLDIKKQGRMPILHQFKPLLIRSFKNFYRAPSIKRGKMMMIILFPFLLGILFFDIIQTIPPLTQPEQLAQYLLNFSAFIFLGLFFSLGKMVFDTILIFPSERQLIMKEVNSNMYSLNVYYLSKIIVQIPGHLIPVLTSTTILYFVIGLQKDVEHYLFFVGVYLLQGFAGFMLGLIIGVLCKTEQLAVQIVPLLMIPMVLFGGLNVNLSTIPAYANWIQYINPIRYGYNALLNSQLKTDSLQNLGHYKIVRQLVGISGDQWSNLIMLILLCYSLFIIAFFFLYLRKNI